MTDDLSALREEVARALRPLRGTEYADADELGKVIADQALTVIFSDPVRLVRVLTGQPCATCGGQGEMYSETYDDCPACNGIGTVDVVGLLVEAGILEAVEQRPWGFDPTIHNPGAAAFRRSSKEGSR